MGTKNEELAALMSDIAEVLDRHGAAICSIQHEENGKHFCVVGFQLVRSEHFGQGHETERLHVMAGDLRYEIRNLTSD